jgi:hypothetical protein
VVDKSSRDRTELVLLLGYEVRHRVDKLMYKRAIKVTTIPIARTVVATGKMSKGDS